MCVQDARQHTHTHEEYATVLITRVVRRSTRFRSEGAPKSASLLALGSTQIRRRRNQCFFSDLPPINVVFSSRTTNNNHELGEAFLCRSFRLFSGERQGISSLLQKKSGKKTLLAVPTAASTAALLSNKRCAHDHPAAKDSYYSCGVLHAWCLVHRPPPCWRL